MVTFRRVEEYDSKEPCPPYTERLDAFFNAKGIEDDEKKRSVYSCEQSAPVRTQHFAVCWLQISPREKNFQRT